MEKVSVQSLNAIFDFLVQQPNTVLWMLSKDYQRQLYLGQPFENIWGEKTEQLFKNPSSWNSYLLEEDKGRVLGHINNRVIEPDTINKDRLLYRIRNTSNQVIFLKSASYLLFDENDVEVSYFGITQVIPELQWHAEIEKPTSINESTLIESSHRYLFDILQNELRLKMGKVSTDTVKNNGSQYSELCAVFHKGRQILLTQREIECLYHLAQGRSAKQTAIILEISPRTVEFHLNNIKDKAFCRTKLELLSKTLTK